MRTVLISAAGTGVGFALACRLRAEWGTAVRLIAADTNPAHLVTASVLADGFHLLPRGDDDRFAPELIDFIRSEGVTTYIPLINAELRKAHQLADELAEVDVWTSAGAAELCCDKRRCAEWLSGIGLPVPRNYTGDQWEPGREYFVKPVDGFGSLGAAIMTGDELAALTPAEQDRLVAQDVCMSPEVTVDSFFDCDKAIGRAVVRERLETKAGVCTKARVFDDDALAGYATTIGESLGQKGSLCFQAMQLNGDWAITDLNFRPGAGTALTVAAGVDLLAAAFACRWGEDYGRFIESPLPAEGLFVTRQYAEFVVTSP